MKLLTLSIFILISSFVMAQSNPISKEIKGTITLVKGLNKAGNVLPGEGDFFLDYNGKSYFVKLSSGKVLRKQLKEVLGVKTTFEVIFDNGLWDTDDPNVQSRTGDFVSILKIHTP